MVRALLPSGRGIYAGENPRVSVSLEDRRYAQKLQKAIRRHLKGDPRYLSIRIQSLAGVSCWQASLRWGDAQEYEECSPLIFAPDEQSPEAIIAKISLKLSRFSFRFSNTEI